VAGRNVKEMGKKGNWFSALKKAFTSGPKEKPTDVSIGVPKLLLIICMFT
jgi:hypothetical protein